MKKDDWDYEDDWADEIASDLADEAFSRGGADDYPIISVDRDVIAAVFRKVRQNTLDEIAKQMNDVINQMSNNLAAMLTTELARSVRNKTKQLLREGGRISK